MEISLLLVLFTVLAFEGLGKFSCRKYRNMGCSAGSFYIDEIDVQDINVRQGLAAMSQGKVALMCHSDDWCQRIRHGTANEALRST